MKPKRVLLLGVLGSMVLMAGIGGTVVLFLRDRELVRAAAAEPVQLEICFLNSREKYTEEQITGLLPGEASEKKPAVILDGTSPEAYLRISLSFGGILEEDPSEDEEQRAERLERIRQLQSGICFAGGWLEGGDGFYYYQEKVSPGSILPVYERVVIPEAWDDGIAEKVFTIELSAEAVRSDELEPWLPEGGEIRSWE